MTTDKTSGFNTSLAAATRQTRHRYLLDANIISSLVRQPTGPVYQMLLQVGSEVVCTSIIVAAEIHFGLAKKRSEILSNSVISILSNFDVLAVEAPAELHYAEIRLALARIGRPIGANDLLIAAHARSLNLTLVSNNTREFERVPGLKLEDWLAQ